MAYSQSESLVFLTLFLLKYQLIKIRWYFKRNKVRNTRDSLWKYAIFNHMLNIPYLLLGYLSLLDIDLIRFLFTFKPTKSQVLRLQRHLRLRLRLPGQDHCLVHRRQRGVGVHRGRLQRSRIRRAGEVRLLHADRLRHDFRRSGVQDEGPWRPGRVRGHWARFLPWQDRHSLRSERYGDDQGLLQAQDQGRYRVGDQGSDLRAGHQRCWRYCQSYLRSCLQVADHQV